MRVISLIGRDAGQEVILPVPVAEAMLADGRAKPVPDRGDYSELERSLGIAGPHNPPPKAEPPKKRRR